MLCVSDFDGYNSMPCVRLYFITFFLVNIFKSDRQIYWRKTNFQKKSHPNVKSLCMRWEQKKNSPEIRYIFVQIPTLISLWTCQTLRVHIQHFSFRAKLRVWWCFVSHSMLIKFSHYSLSSCVYLTVPCLPSLFPFSFGTNWKIRK